MRPPRPARRNAVLPATLPCADTPSPKSTDSLPGSSCSVGAPSVPDKALPSTLSTVDADELATIYASLRSLIADIDLVSRPSTPLPTVPPQYKQWTQCTCLASQSSHTASSQDSSSARVLSTTRSSSVSSYSCPSSFVHTPNTSPRDSAADPWSSTVQITQLQDKIDDLQDENKLLRAQLTLLSEQLATSKLSCTNTSL